MQRDTSIKSWFRSGSPWVWFNAGAVAISMILVLGLLGLIAVRGLMHFWPSDVAQMKYLEDGDTATRIIAVVRETDEVLVTRLREAGITLDSDKKNVQRHLLKVGNRDVYGSDFRYAIEPWIEKTRYPEGIVLIERREWGDQIGYLRGIEVDGKPLEVKKGGLWGAFRERMNRALDLHAKIEEIEKDRIGSINYEIDQLRLEEKELNLEGELTPAAKARIEKKRERLKAKYSELESRLSALYEKINRDSYRVEVQNGNVTTERFANVVRAYRPNAMDFFDKLGFYFVKIGAFVSEEPREANTEGGVFPAIFGTVMMVLLMSVFVTPFGVVAAVYLKEYAKQGPLVRTIRIAVNNLAGVPSIVYGVFGLGFFVYFLGGSIDQLFYQEALPSPTFGTGGILWASLTLAILTLPVVIVATEEGLSRIPKSVREGSYALGATRAETLWRTVIPMASPAMMTGLILAVARAAGEVAPLMLVGVVKLAPSLPLDSNAPFLHLDRKFMHLGFHIYDVGFQSPNVEAARPLVYATALLLVVVIVVLNLLAVRIRNRLREKYRSLEH